MRSISLVASICREIAGAVAAGMSPANREIAAGKAASTIRARMSTTLEAVRPIELSEIREARKRIAKTIVRTPLIRLEAGSDQPDIRLKLENLQPINAYKLRGATNAVAMQTKQACHVASS
jgi:hypothetical protein